MKLTRHNGRAGKNGTYNPRHNDRNFDVENSEHIDAERARQNIYWDCYQGIRTGSSQEQDADNQYSFDKIEKAYYFEKYFDFVSAQNERNEKTRHTERNRTVDDLLKNNKTCPEETIYQIGTIEESASAEDLLLIATEFFEELDRRFGEHVHILDWALHLDEGTPHIHERHVFDCENKYGELSPQQEKALEFLEIPLPDPDKPKGKNNNRKKTFDAVCRTILFDISKRHGLCLDEEPVYGGREYLEKQDFILQKQKEKISIQKQALEDITMKLEDVEALVDEIADTAYEKACEAITDTVREETQKQDIEVVENYKVWLSSPERKAPKEKRDYAVQQMEKIQEKMRKTALKILTTVQNVLHSPAVKEKNREMVKEHAQISLMEKLRLMKDKADSENAKHLKGNTRITDIDR